MGGFLNFYAITPSPMKNQLLCRIKHINEEETTSQEKIAFPFRGVDYDPERKMLFTGDEMGYMMQWDVSSLLDKLEQVQEDYNKQKGNSDKQDATFVTGTTSWDKIKFSESDVKQLNCWKAHTESINCVTWIKDLKLVGSCSYDCNVYLWGTDTDKIEHGKGDKKGSLVLGNKATAPGAELDPETRKYRRGWKVEVDKVTRYKEEIQEAEEIWNEVD